MINPAEFKDGAAVIDSRLAGILKFSGKLCRLTADEDAYHPGTRTGVPFSRESLSAAERDELDEFTEGHAFIDHDRAFVPFFLFGKPGTEEGESVLIKVMRYINDGILLLDSETGELYISDEGSLCKFNDSIENLSIKPI